MTDPPDREMAVFSAARRLPVAERAAYLDAACAGDAVLRERIEELLRATEEAGAFLQDPAPGAQLPAGAAASPSPVSNGTALGEKAGDRIGHYKLLQQIGEGGCGVVYLAEQEEPVRRRVALKVIKLGMDTKQVIARFEAERQALALMDHPNIAKVLEAGATGTGRPYFVMELVRGIKITDYCDDNHLSTEARLDLFIQIAQAVQHAHQKGIIHRDLKPSNILVADHDGVPVPKIIDFGIAKATSDLRLTDKTLFTAFEQFIGTPAYMSPEQARMSGLDIDTRTDIYSLGVLLYELLTGKTPFDAAELLSAGLDEMRRTISEKEPVRPSTRLSTMLEGELTTTAKHRHTDAPKLVHLIRGDLDWIVMKALEKERGRRYETANGLAMDVQRYLADEPVVACPPGNFYRFRKLVQRNKLVFAAAAAVATVLVLGVVVSAWQAIRATHAEREQIRLRQRAEDSEKQARLINQFLTEDVLGQATPEQNAHEKNITVIEALNAATSRLDQRAEIRQQPELEASLRLAVGRTYSELNLLSEAERNLRKAVTLRRSVLGRQNLDTLAAQNELAKLLLHQRKNEESEGLSRETWEGRRRLLGAEHRDTLDSLEFYETALTEQGKLQEAEPIALQLLHIRERILGPDDPATISSLGGLGQLMTLRREHAEAEHYVREALTRLQRNGLADTRDGFLCVKEIALSRLLQGDPAEAEKLLTEAAPRAAHVFGPDDLLTLFIQRVLVRALAEERKLEKAEAVGKQTLDARRRTKANQDGLGTGRTLLYLGRVLVEESKLDEAEPLLQEALTIFRQDPASRPTPELAAQAENWLGAIQLARRAYPEAEALLMPNSDRVSAANTEMSTNERRMAVGHIIELYETWNKPDQAAEWKKKLAGTDKGKKGG